MDVDRTANATIQDQIDDAYKTAFKAKEEKIYIALRPVLSTIKQATIDKRRELSNDEIIALLQTEVKKRKEVMEDFKRGNRQDLIDQTENEIKQISHYLPAQMPDEALETAVKEAIAAVGASSPADTGKVMGAVMGKVKGKADGTRVKELVQKLLS